MLNFPMSLLLESFIVFAIIVVVDICWVKYVSAIADRERLMAANYSMLVYVLGAFVVTEYVSNKWMLIPACLGAWCGTYFGMRNGKV